MESINRIIINGSLTKEPEYKNVGESIACRFQLAAEKSFLNKKTGEASREMCFVDVELWGAQATLINQNKSVAKGTQILVEGRLKLSSWVDGMGQKRQRHLIAAERAIVLEAPKPQQEAVSVDYFAGEGTGESSNTGIKPDPAIAVVEKFVNDLPF